MELVPPYITTQYGCEQMLIISIVQITIFAGRRGVKGESLT